MVGTVLAGRYEIVQEIGSGGMAIVYKAKCRILNRYVAIKVLRTDLKDDGEFVRRFNIEAQAAASLTHSNIVSIYDVGTEGDLHYIVMEYVEGITLKDYIDKNILLNWHEAVGYAIQIACGLEQAHKNSIVHRDIKPHNIIMTHDGVLKITDFGIARASVQSTVTCEDTAIGSVHYVSPEQARGGYVDERSDIYSLGIVLYEMLTGKVPFDNESPVSIALMHLQTPPTPPREHNISIPKDVEDIVLKAMSKELSGRYKTISDFKNDLTAVAESGIPTAVPASNDSETSDVDDLGGTAIFTAAKDISIPYENNQEPSAKSNLIPSDALEHESAPDIEIIDDDEEEYPMGNSNKKKKNKSINVIVIFAALIASALIIWGVVSVVKPYFDSLFETNQNASSVDDGEKNDAINDSDTKDNNATDDDDGKDNDTSNDVKNNDDEKDNDTSDDDEKDDDKKNDDKKDDDEKDDDKKDDDKDDNKKDDNKKDDNQTQQAYRKRFVISGPEEKDSAHVEVKVNGKTIKSITLAKGEETIVTVQSSVPTATVEVYHDGKLEHSETIDMTE
ncbi:MAG: Stk1 family PASTA domain-containing Ser/Thr kinase [Ruminococcaceae bacterium]|nr:Stk1 family PASTA domain-containing Ser/Thr kinase [Oscillospiraceae bacterium]